MKGEYGNISPSLHLFLYQLHISVCPNVFECVCLVVYSSHQELEWQSGNDRSDSPCCTKDSAFNFLTSSRFVVTFSDVMSDPFKRRPPAKLSLTCKCGPRGRTLSRADRGRNHGDKGRPPPHTGRLVTKGERKYLCF